MSTPPTAFDWSARYGERNTPWDLGAAHPELVARLSRGEWLPPRPGARALVPGCGYAHDALALARAGWAVTAIDVVGTLAEPVTARLAPFGSRFLVEDALAHRAGETYDLLFEHTFFCALDPAQRPAWGELARANVAGGGHLVVLLFPVGKPASEGGPPHGVERADYETALGRGWRPLEHGPCAHGAPQRTWRQEVAVYVREA